MLNPADDPLTSGSVTYATVSQGEVGATLNLNATANWPAQENGTNQASGIVTSVDVEPAEEVSAGDVIYTIDLRPVVVAQGDIPSFRPISRGVVGGDVSQLQRLLSSLGFYNGVMGAGRANEPAVGPGRAAALIAVDERQPAITRKYEADADRRGGRLECVQDHVARRGKRGGDANPVHRRCQASTWASAD